MPKHRHHHHSKSPSRRNYSPEERRNGRTADGRQQDGVVRHRHRSTPPRAEIRRRRSLEEDVTRNSLAMTTNQLPYATMHHQPDAYRLAAEAAGAASYHHRSPAALPDYLPVPGKHEVGCYLEVTHI